MEKHDCQCPCRDELTMNDYQAGALSTANVYRDVIRDLSVSDDMKRTLRILYVASGLAGEAGEIANKVKKILRDHKGVLTEEMAAGLAMELGDVQWYTAAMADELDYTLEIIAQANLDKLARRALAGKIKGSGDKR